MVLAVSVGPHIFLSVADILTALLVCARLDMTIAEMASNLIMSFFIERLQVRKVRFLSINYCQYYVGCCHSLQTLPESQ